MAKHVGCYGGFWRLFNRLGETAQRHPAHREFGIQSSQNKLSPFRCYLSRQLVSEDDLDVVSPRKEFDILSKENVILMNGFILFGAQWDIKPSSKPGDNFSRRFTDNSDYVELDNLLIAFAVELHRVRRDFERQRNQVALPFESERTQLDEQRQGRIGLRRRHIGEQLFIIRCKENDFTRGIGVISGARGHMHVWAADFHLQLAIAAVKVRAGAVKGERVAGAYLLIYAIQPFGQVVGALDELSAGIA